MRRIFIALSVLTLSLQSCKTTQSVAEKPTEKVPVASPSLAYNPYEKYPTYSGKDLGVTYTTSKTTLKIWSPPAQEMKLKLYKTSLGNDLIEEINCTKDKTGVWTAVLNGDKKNIYYVFQAKIDGKWNAEEADPYAKAVGTNGKRGQIVNLSDTNPTGWNQDKKPAFKNPTDAVLYELHIRDLSSAANSGIKNKGKYLAFTEFGTKNSQGLSTGIDHIAEMGVTHVHLLPSFDYRSVDETKLNEPQFNWGYDPQNYNAPEGSYATNSEDGKVRIKEYKQMVQALHQKGLRVVMDVVYNHTGTTHDSNFDQLVPGYYYRQWQKDGKFSDASACGNEIASDRAMVRKFMIESVLYWAKEYHVDGFRFDLMAIHDTETMNQIAAELHKIDPSIIIYGEGWTAGDSPLPEQYRALKTNVNKMKGVAVFSDDIRDGIKGSVFEEKSVGFATGSKDMNEAVKMAIVASTQHKQVDYTKGTYAKTPYANNPTDIVNYVSCHDNQTLYDKIKVSRPDASEEDLIKMHKLANTIVVTSQGIPFLHAGVEMKRTKGGEHNSYNKPDAVNQINWDWKSENKDLVEYYKSLIALRKAHPAFRMTTNTMIQSNLEFLPVFDSQVIAYQLKDNANGDSWRQIVVILNGADTAKTVDLPVGMWNAALKDYQFNKDTKTYAGNVSIAPYSAIILYQK